MKKTKSFILCVALLLVLAGCRAEEKAPAPAQVLLKSLQFDMSSYLVGFTTSYVFDFEKNVVQESSIYQRYYDEPQFTQIAAFSDDQEKTLIEKLDSFGFFDQEEDYPPPGVVYDGGGWDLTVEYADGTVKRSKGNNNFPKLFADCAKAFYDICERGVCAYVPEEYYSPPYMLSCSMGNHYYDGFGKRLDYRWNGFKSEGNSICDANKMTSFPDRLYKEAQYKYKMTLCTDSRYDSIVKNYSVKYYDDSIPLADPTPVRSGEWYKETSFELELDKIYLIRLDFKNGDFAEFTFNTRTTPR